MRASNIFKTFALFIAAVSFTAAASAQDGRPADGPSQDAQRPADQKPQDNRFNILRQLGLTREQAQQIRRINMERKPLMDEAQRRFRAANRAMDAAIYSDQFNENDVRDRLKEVQLAQAEVTRIRLMNEVAVRRILTPEQLVRFREMRQRFESTREMIENRVKENRVSPPNDGRSQPDGQQPVRRFLKEKRQESNM